MDEGKKTLHFQSEILKTSFEERYRISFIIKRNDVCSQTELLGNLA